MKRAILVGSIGTAVLWMFSGFAVNSNGEWNEKEKTRKGWLGVSIQSVNRTLAEEKGLKSDDGAYVVDVVEDSPADSVGLRKGDVVIEFGGRKIYDADDLAKTVSRTEPGTRTSILLMRNGEQKSFQVTVGKLPRPSRYAFSMGSRPGFRMFHGGSGMLGLSVLSLNEQLAKYFGAPGDEGVLIEMVKNGSPAEKAGLMAGDVILRVETRTVDEVGDIWKALEKYDEGDKVEIEVLRKGSRKTVSVVLEDLDEEPWGFHMPSMPKIHVFPGHREDIDFNFDVEVAPELKRIERHIQELSPRLERIAPRIERRIEQRLGNAFRRITI